MESDDEITFVEPYVDMQTGEVMMTVTDMLADGESVIALDVSLKPIQEIIEKISMYTD
ncbi:MAG: hypothetical protein IJ619_04100 [Eubacterium sp.]|nr:hypothetical protein [Eubacterium sp.]